MYQLYKDDTYIIRVEDNVFIPNSLDNSYYVAYLAWLSEGNVPLPAEIIIPQYVTRFQAKAALYLAGLLPKVQEIMSGPDTETLTLMAWNEAQYFYRDSPAMLKVARMLGMADEEIDSMFITAGKISI